MLQMDEGEEMTIYDAIFVRKSIRNYKMEPLSKETLDLVRGCYEDVQQLFLGINTELRIIDCLENKDKVAMFGVRAPYYLAIYTEEQDKCIMNAGFIMEQLSLYLCRKGLGSCFVGSPVISRKYSSYNGKRLAALLAFGKAKGSVVRKQSEFRRLEMSQLCVYKEPPRQWIRQILEVGRLAPSSTNSQPWRFLVYDNRIHVFCRNGGRGTTKRMRELNFGVLFSHMMVAAEELWLDLDLIRLENISQKSFHNSEYVLSAVLNS